MTTLISSRYARWAAAILLLGTIFRLWYSTHLELVGDEAYYWLWSRHPDICYLDKGPVIAWFISAGTALFGQTVFGIRFFATLLALGTGIGIFFLARRLFSDRVAFWSVLLAALTPLFAVGATLMTIDTVYIFFWTLAALTFWHAKDQTRLGWWLLTGVLVGLSMLSKYTGAIELLSFVGFCAWHPPSRATFPKTDPSGNASGRCSLPDPGHSFGTGNTDFRPAISWSIAAPWTSGCVFVRLRCSLSSGSRPESFLLSFFLAAGGRFLAAASRRRRACRPGTLSALFLPLFLVYLVLSFQKASQANWAAAAYVSGLILVAAKWCEAVRIYPWARWVVCSGLAIAFLETALLHETSWLHLPGRLDPLDRARGSRDLAAQVSALQTSSGAPVCDRQ